MWGKRWHDAVETALSLTLALIAAAVQLGAQVNSNTPSVPAGGVVNCASYTTSVVAGSCAVVFGSNLATSTVFPPFPAPPSF